MRPKCFGVVALFLLIAPGAALAQNQKVRVQAWDLGTNPATLLFSDDSSPASSADFSFAVPRQVALTTLRATDLLL